jgi:phage gp29-like protein
VAVPARKTAAFATTAFEKDEASLWHETVNPLRGLSIDRAAAIYDQARLGAYADLTWLYQEIEAADPTLMICAERRSASVAELDWTIAQKAAKRLGSAWDAALAQEQQDYLEAAYGACTNFLDGVEWLGSAFFRGFAHVRPEYAIDGRSLVGFVTLDQWNFVRNRKTAAWHWNPKALGTADVDGLAEIPAGELVSLVRVRHIDYPALPIFIRSALGERKWGVFIERYGVPPVMIIMPQFADATDEARYMTAASNVAKGGSGALPNGSLVSYGTEARGTDPFTLYLKHQQELTVLLATGGLATSLSMPSGLGDGPSGQHGDTWRTIVTRDARLIAQALNQRCTADLLAAGFPGRPHLAELRFQTEATPSAKEVFEAGAGAKAAGYVIAQADLEKRSGYKLERDGGGAAAGMGAAAAAVPSWGAARNKAAAIPPAAAMESAALDALAEARAKELAPVIDRLLAALELTDPDDLKAALGSLLDDLPKLLEAAAAEPDSAALLERILSDAVGAGWAEIAPKAPTRARATDKE